ncbi:MAG: FHA domain-containing protein [Anaerolineales bacterium]|nr:FHA domain-containing protein [Anaerolineales bacterium]
MDNSQVFRLVMRKGPQMDKEYALVKDIVSLGRDSTNDFPVPDPEVSRRHARLVKQGKDYFIEDLGSTNGTFVNRARVSAPFRLSAGDEIGFGETVSMVFEAPLPDIPGTIVSDEDDFVPDEDSTMAADISPHPYDAGPDWNFEPYKEPEFEPPAYGIKAPQPPEPEPFYAPPPPEPEPTYAPPPPVEPLPSIDPPSFRPSASATVSEPDYSGAGGEEKKSRKGLYIGCGCLLALVICALVGGLAYLLWNAPTEFWNDPLNNFDRLLGLALPFLTAL